MSIQSVNPSTGEILGTVQASSPAEVKEKVASARNALRGWKEAGLQGRVQALRKVVEILKKRSEEFSQLASREMGMPVSQSIHDVNGAITYFEWYLDTAEKYLSPEVVYEDDTMVHTVHFDPVGVVAAITPWNFPASNFVWMIGQNLIIGNTVVFKDSGDVPLCGKFIEEVFEQASLPEGVFAEVYGRGEIGDLLVHQDIDMICFTGSTATGRHLYKVGAEKFIKVFLELGGSAPGIVCADADIDAVIGTLYANRFDNCGQICDGLKRLIVHESRLVEVLSKLKEKLDSVTIGDASDKKTDIGPLANEKQLRSLENQVADAFTKGAVTEYVGKIPKRLKGYFYPPTVLTNITREMRVWKEEVFGPVLPIVTYHTENEAIELANDTEYGLGGYIFTTNKARFESLASKVESGMVMMNNASYVAPPSPFGGCKSSGLGREHGRFGFQELCNIKVIATEK